MDKQQIKQIIASLPDHTDDELVHIIKCSLSRVKASEKALLKPLIKAIEKERRKRGTSQTISSRPIQPKAPVHGANSDDY